MPQAVNKKRIWADKSKVENPSNKMSINKCNTFIINLN